MVDINVRRPTVILQQCKALHMESPIQDVTIPENYGKRQKILDALIVYLVFYKNLISKK